MTKRDFSVGFVLACLALVHPVEECLGQGHNYEQRGLTSYQRVDLLYAYVTAMWPPDEIWPKMREAMTNIADTNEAAAQAVIGELLTEFSENQYLPVALHEIAKLYRLVEERDRSLGLHQHVVDNWPSHEYTMWSLRDLAILNIALGDLKGAQAAINRALTGFANNVYIAFVGYDIAGYYKDFKYYQEAKELYEYVIDHWPEHETYVEWCQAGLKQIEAARAGQAAAETVIKAHVDSAKSSIASNDMEAAEATINELLTNYSRDPHIADPVFEIAEHYQEFKEYEKAKVLYQYVVDNWPGEVSASWAQSRLAVCHIGLGEIEAAEAATAKLLADFPKNTTPMAGCVYDIAQQYYQSGQYQKAEEYYRYVLETWPDFPERLWARIGLVASQAQLGDTEEAVRSLDELVGRSAGALYLAGQEPEMLIRAGQWYHYLGEYAKSMECYDRTINNHGQTEYACRAQFLIADNLRGLKEAGAISESEADGQIESAYNAVFENYRDCELAKDALVKLGRMHLKKNQWVEAAQYYELFIESYPTDPLDRIASSLGKCYENLGSEEAANQIYEEFMKRRELQ